MTSKDDPMECTRCDKNLDGGDVSFVYTLHYCHYQRRAFQITLCEDCAIDESYPIEAEIIEN